MTTMFPLATMRHACLTIAVAMMALPLALTTADAQTQEAAKGLVCNENSPKYRFVELLLLDSQDNDRDGYQYRSSSLPNTEQYAWASAPGILQHCAGKTRYIQRKITLGDLNLLLYPIQDENPDVFPVIANRGHPRTTAIARDIPDLADQHLFMEEGSDVSHGGYILVGRSHLIKVAYLTGFEQVPVRDREVKILVFLYHTEGAPIELDDVSLSEDQLRSRSGLSGDVSEPATTETEEEPDPATGKDAARSSDWRQDAQLRGIGAARKRQ